MSPPSQPGNQTFIFTCTRPKFTHTWTCFFFLPWTLLFIQEVQLYLLPVVIIMIIIMIVHSPVSILQQYSIVKYKPSCWILENSLFILHRLVNNFWQDLNLWWLLLDIQETITKPNTKQEKMFLMDDCSCNLTKTKEIKPDLSQPIEVMQWTSGKCNRKEQC